MTSENLTLAARRRSVRGPGPRRALGVAVMLGLIAAATAWLLTPGTAAYVGQNPYAVRLDGPTGTVPCSTPVTITAIVKDAESGEAIGEQYVFWSLKTSQSKKDEVKPARTTTANDGTTSVQLTFGSEPGKRKVQAMIADYPATFSVTCGDVQTPEPSNAAASSAPTDQPTTGPTDSSQPTLPAPTSNASPGAPTSPPATDTAVGSAAPPTTTAIGGTAAPPAPTAAAAPTPASSAGGGGISAPVILVGGVVLLGAAALLLWSIARRRSGAGQPPA